MNFFTREETVAKTKYDKLSEDYYKLYYENNNTQLAKSMLLEFM